MKRRQLLNAIGGGTILAGMVTSSTLSDPQQSPVVARPPNFVLILGDDLGYGDLGVYGHPVIRTPNLDRMACEGLKLANFYASAPLCTPSRAALLTGRYPIHSGLVRVLFPGEKSGISDYEITLGTALQRLGYVTACIGKWHLGDLPPYRPNKHGFDYYFGLLYSSDMDQRIPQLEEKFRFPYPLSLYRNDEIIESPVERDKLTQYYNDEAVKFIQQNKDRPFFLYLPHSMPHWPWQASEKFRGKCPYGIYGDAVEEIDWGVGEIIRTLREKGIEDNTLVMFTSDNGADLSELLNRAYDVPLLPGGGSNGILRGGKGSTWEGGFRAPFLARWPGKVPAGIERLDIACTMDLFTTIVELAGGKVPDDRPIDGVNIWPTLQGTQESRREDFFYFSNASDTHVQILAMRSGKWKLHFRRYDFRGPAVFHPEALYNLDEDPSEKYDQAKDQPQTVASLVAKTTKFHAGLKA